MDQGLPLVLRAAIFVGVVLWMQAGPVMEQLLDQPRPPGTMAWKMYRTRGRDLCGVEWFSHAPDGTLTPIDRHAVLGWDRYRPVRRIEGEVEVRRAAARLCRELPSGTDLRVRARCGSARGWEPSFDVDTPMCSP